MGKSEDSRSSRTTQSNPAFVVLHLDQTFAPKHSVFLSDHDEPSDSITIQSWRMKVPGLPINLPTDRFSFLTADLSTPTPGLEP
jgi:hypothetical protein